MFIFHFHLWTFRKDTYVPFLLHTGWGQCYLLVFFHMPAKWSNSFCFTWEDHNTTHICLSHQPHCWALLSFFLADSSCLSQSLQTRNHLVRPEEGREKVSLELGLVGRLLVIVSFFSHVNPVSHLLFLLVHIPVNMFRLPPSKLRPWPPQKSLPWLSPSDSIKLVSSSARVTPAKSQKGLLRSHWVREAWNHRQDPRDTLVR